LGIFPALALSRHRYIFLQTRFYLAVMIGLIIIFPNLLWQYNNNFPIIQHLSELADTQLVHVDRLGFLKSQLLFYIGSLFVILAGLFGLLFYKPFRKYGFFFSAIIFTLTTFIYFKAKDYYAIGIYPIYIAFGSVYLSEILRTGWKKYLQPIVVAIPLLLFIPIYNVAFPNKSPEYITQHPGNYKKLGMLRWEDGKDHLLPQDFADMLGWKELAIKVDSIYAEMPDPAHTLILCDNYGQAGAINYYTTNKNIVASSFSADYVNWLDLDKKITDVILIKEKDDEDKKRKEEIPLFDTIYLAGQRINNFAREDTISIYVLKGAKTDINKKLEYEANRRKNYR
jgi:hypothetical protein